MWTVMKTTKPEELPTSTRKSRGNATRRLTRHRQRQRDCKRQLEHCQAHTLDTVARPGLCPARQEAEQALNSGNFMAWQRLGEGCGGFEYFDIEDT